jgi:hypothetical protein
VFLPRSNFYRVRRTQLFLSHLACCRVRKFAISIRTPHQQHSHVCAKTDGCICALAGWLADTHFTLSATARHTPAVSIFQYAQGAPLSIIRASLALGWGWCDISYFFITQLASDDLMIFPAAAPAAAPSYRGKRCGELLRCLTPVTFYYFTVINLARMQTLY